MQRRPRFAALWDNSLLPAASATAAAVGPGTVAIATAHSDAQHSGAGHAAVAHCHAGVVGHETIPTVHCLASCTVRRAHAVLSSLQTARLQRVDQPLAGDLAVAFELDADRLMLRVKCHLGNALNLAQGGCRLLPGSFVIDAGDAQEEYSAILHVSTHHVRGSRHRAGDLLRRDYAFVELGRGRLASEVHLDGLHSLGLL